MVALEQVLSEAQKNNRVCPQPQNWQELYELLPNKKRGGEWVEPGPPSYSRTGETTAQLN